MKLVLGILLILSFVTCIYASISWTRTYQNKTRQMAPLLGMDNKNRVLNDFFVLIDKNKVREKSRDRAVGGFVDHLKSRITKNTDYYDMKNVYVFGDLVILRIKLPERLVSILQEHTDVKIVEANQRLSINGNVTNDYKHCMSQGTGTDLWGLSRISSRSPVDKNSKYYYLESPAQYRDLSLYVVDTGIYTKHNEFKQGQVSHGYTAESMSGEGDGDLFGHGTHVAGTIAGMTYGVAKGAPIIAVKVLDKNGEGTAADIIDGIQWIYDDFMAKKKLLGNKAKGIINMSLGAQVVHQVMEASMIETFTDLGLTFVVAAGNEAHDACAYSPGRQSWLITVGAIDVNDKVGHYSNYGPCVDILAPGSGIKSATIGSPTASAIADGTSMAAPHVTGVLARYLDTQCEAPSPELLKGWLLNYATESVVTLTDIGITPNKLLYMSCFWDDSTTPNGPDGYTIGASSDNYNTMMITLYVGFSIIIFFVFIILCISIIICKSVMGTTQPKRLTTR